MSENVTSLDEYRARFNHPTAPKYVVRQDGDHVALAIAEPVIRLTPEKARKLAEELTDRANSIEDWG